MSDSNSESVKIGDVVAWDKVPSGSLARTVGGDFALRIGDDGHWVRLVGEIKMDWARAGAWGGWSFDEGEVVDEGPSTIIALGLTGQEAAAELQRMAEVYEVREALRKAPFVRRHIALAASSQPTPGWREALEMACEHPDLRKLSCDTEECLGGFECVTLLGWLAERLSAAGWRRGMTAEDAARLLAEADKTRTK